MYEIHQIASCQRKNSFGAVPRGLADDGYFVQTHIFASQLQHSSLSGRQLCHGAFNDSHGFSGDDRRVSRSSACEIQANDFNAVFRRFPSDVNANVLCDGDGECFRTFKLLHFVTHLPKSQVSFLNHVLRHCRSARFGEETLTKSQQLPACLLDDFQKFFVVH